MAQQTSSIKHTPQATKSTGVFPIVCLLVAATLWGILWYPLRVLEQQDLHGLWLTLLIYAGTGWVVLPVLWRRCHELAKAPGLLLGVALASGWCNTSFILAILDGHVVRVLLLFYLSPLWTTLLGWLILKESLTQRAIVMLVIAMTGALFMLWSPELGFPLPRDHADWLALSSGMAFAIANVLVRKVQGVSVLVKTVAGWCGVMIIAGVLIAITEQGIGQPEPLAVIGALALGAIGMVIMTLSVVNGVTHMPVHRSAVILLFELVIGAVSALILTNEVILLREWIGGSLVVLAAYLSARAYVHG